MLTWKEIQQRLAKRTTGDSLFFDTAKHFSSIDDIIITYNNQEKIELYTDENYLKTIMRNLTGNAIKALEKTKNPKIEWNAYTKGNKIILSICDNGPGGSKEQFKALYDEAAISGISSGLGLHLIRDLAKIIKAEISIDTNSKSGTTIKICL